MTAMPYRLTLAAGLTALLSSLANPVLAAWPERAITLIVPGAPGGTTDIPTRLLGQKMSAALGVPVVVENRAGSGGIIGAQQAMRAAPDGYTLVMGNTGSHAINYSAYKNLAYAPTDFVPITDMISFTNVLVVGPASPYTRVADIVAAMKQRPGTVTNASAGIGQTTHLTGEMFKIRTGVQGVHVPYKGSTPATMSVMSGETAFMFDNLTQSLPQIQAGKLRALAVTSAQRSADLPDTPTMKEAGVDDFVVMGWLGLFAPKGTPPEVVARIYESVAVALKDPEIQARYKQMGGVAGGMPPARFTTYVNDEIARWRTTVQAIDLKLE